MSSDREFHIYDDDGFTIETGVVHSMVYYVRLINEGVIPQVVDIPSQCMQYTGH